ncbi:MAG: TonB family protein [Oligoflexia bacterium]|nr:TonB family protein [Oligoflexia bacterium]
MILSLLQSLPVTVSLLIGAPAFAQAADEPTEALPPITVSPALLEFVEAVYPPAAAAEGVTATVTLLINIDATGAVTGVTVLDEPARQGTEPGQPTTWGFGQAAVAAARQWHFSPAEDANGPTPVKIEFAYEFKAPPSSEPAPGPPASAAPIQITGVLIEMGTRRPLSGFPIVATDSTGHTLEQDTDGDGRFALSGLTPGSVHLASTYPGYARVEKTVLAPPPPAEGEALTPTKLKLWLRNLSYRDDEIVGVYKLPVQDVTKRTVSTAEVRAIPGTFGDPVRVIQDLPGAARAPLGTGLLVIRGSNPEDSGVYIDGIRVPLIYHLGAYSSVINADLVDSVDYLPGGYGTQYGRSTGGVIDIKTKHTFPERTKVNWNTDLLDTSVLVEGQAGKKHGLGYAVAGRRSYIDAFIPLFTGDTGFTIKPRWYDYQLKLDALNLPKGHLSTFLFGFQDVLRVSTPSDYAQGTDQDTQGDIGTKYGTHRIMVEWDRPIGDHLALRMVPSLGVDTAQFNLGESFDLTQLQSLLELRTELKWTPVPAMDLTAGVDFIGGWYKFQTQFPFDPTTFANYDPLAEREPFTQSGTGWAWGPDLYLEMNIRPLADSKRLLLQPGLRADMMNIVGQVDIKGLDPRFMLRAELFDGGLFKLGTGLYNQPPQPFESWRPGGGVDVRFENAWSNEIGWEQQFTPGLSADVSVYYKFLQRQIVPNPDLSSIDDQFFVNQGIGRAYGIETIIRQAPIGRFFGWVSYTLSRSVRNDYPSSPRIFDGPGLLGPFDSADGWYSYDFDQTHILVAVAGYKLPRDWEISGKMQYVTGNPTTPYSGGIYDIDQDIYQPYSTGAYNTERLPAFFETDLRIDKLFTFKRWQLEVFLDLLNVLRGTNPEFTQYNYDYTQTAYIRGLPFIPSPGFQADFEF